jgi:hypothetical protein
MSGLGRSKMGNTIKPGPMADTGAETHKNTLKRLGAPGYPLNP